MSSSGLGWISVGDHLVPFELVLNIQFIDIVEGGSFIIHSSMPSEDINLAFVESSSVVCSGLWGSDLGPGVLWFSNRFLIGRLEPLEVG